MSLLYFRLAQGSSMATGSVDSNVLIMSNLLPSCQRSQEGPWFMARADCKSLDVSSDTGMSCKLLSADTAARNVSSTAPAPACLVREGKCQRFAAWKIAAVEPP